MLRITKKIGTKNINKINLHGDSNISKLALLVSSLCNGISTIKNISKSYEIDNLIKILNSFSINVNDTNGIILINGLDVKHWKQPNDVINIKNSIDVFFYLANIISKTNFRTFITGHKNILSNNFVSLKYLNDNHNLNFKKNYCLPVLINGTSNFKQSKVQVDDLLSKYSIIFNIIANRYDCIIYENELKEEYLEHILRYYGFEIKETLSEKRNILNKNSKKNKEIYIKHTKTINGKEFFVPVSILETVYTIFLGYILNIDEFIIENISLNELNSDIISILIDNGVNITYKNQRIVNDIKIVDFHIKYSNLRELSISRKRLANTLEDYQLIIMLNILKRNKINIAGIKELKLKESKDYNQFINIIKSINVTIRENKDMLEIDPSSLNIGSYNLILDDNNNLSNKTKLVLFMSNIALSNKVFELRELNYDLLNIFPNLNNVLEQLNFTIKYDN